MFALLPAPPGAGMTVWCESLKAGLFAWQGMSVVSELFGTSASARGCEWFLGYVRPYQYCTAADSAWSAEQLKPIQRYPVS